ncbi:MAG: hypothetical protein ACKPB0_13750 [Opitutaceae bacterium]
MKFALSTLVSSAPSHSPAAVARSIRSKLSNCTIVAPHSGCRSAWA